MDKHITAFLGGCNWQSGPPKHWKRELDRALWITALAKQTELPVVVRNRPVPRAANHHYDRLTSDIGFDPNYTRWRGVKSLALTTDGSTFYFY